MSRESLGLRPGAEPLSVHGGPVGVLLIHGFTGSPASMRPWALHLAEAGHTVRVPCLPGHGTTWQDLNRTGWTRWYDALDQELHGLRQDCDQVAVFGLSMGGCLALRLAQQRLGDVDALVLVNPAVTLSNPALRLLPILKHVVPSLKGIANDIKRPGADEIAYDRLPLKALASQVQLWKDVCGRLGDVRAPLLMFGSEEDHVVDSSSRRKILADVSSTTLVDVPLTDSYHVATLDNDAEFIFARSDEFIAEHLVDATHE